VNGLVGWLVGWLVSWQHIVSGTGLIKLSIMALLSAIVTEELTKCQLGFIYLNLNYLNTSAGPTM
jgi:hypothetical protein